MERFTLGAILTKEYLEEEYIKKRRFTTDIASDIGCSPGSVCKYLKKYGITIESRYFERECTPRKNPARKILENKEFLLEKYVREGQSQAAIAFELRCAIKLVSEYLKKHGIPIEKKRRTVFYNEQHSRYKDYMPMKDGVKGNSEGVKVDESICNTSFFF